MNKNKRIVVEFTNEGNVPYVAADENGDSCTIINGSYRYRNIKQPE